MLARVPRDGHLCGMSRGWLRGDGLDFPAAATAGLRWRAGQWIPLVAVDAEKCVIFCIVIRHSAGCHRCRVSFPVAIGWLIGAVSRRGASVHRRSGRRFRRKSALPVAAIPERSVPCRFPRPGRADR